MPAVVQKYAEWDSRAYSGSKKDRKASVDARKKLRQEMQMESRKRYLLIFKQITHKLKTVLKMTKHKKVCKAVEGEIHGNKDLIMTLIQSGVPDLDLPDDIPLQISTDKSKYGIAQRGGLKLP